MTVLVVRTRWCRFTGASGHLGGGVKTLTVTRLAETGPDSAARITWGFSFRARGWREMRNSVLVGKTLWEA